MTAATTMDFHRMSIASDSSAAAAVEALASAASSPQLAIRSVLLDRATVQVFSVLLPVCSHLKVLIFAECRLDIAMLELLKQGLKDCSNCSVEALQLEWNPLEIPLPMAEELVKAGEHEGMVTFEARERHRYRIQTLRSLKSFRSWISDLAGGKLERAFDLLAGSSLSEAPLTSDSFPDLLDEALGARGQQVAEVFEALDGPDFAGGTGRLTLASIRSALEALPADIEESADGKVESDVLGAAWSMFFEGDCVLESLSLRACGIDRPEIATMAEALKQQPWQLRCLNLWDNRISTKGAVKLASALNVYRGLEYLGLARNRITDEGLAALCEPFQATFLDEAGAAAAKAKIAEQENAIAAKAKAAAKAAAKAGAKGARGSVGSTSPTTGGRPKREAKTLVDILEERPAVVEGGGPSFLLRRPSDLKVLVLSENPITDVRTVETLQPLGPRGADLLLKQTPAGAALLAKKTELLVGKEKRP
eukprot:CAMPEP_0206438928 /NCGR_PEP_ID=MMETSP0324_2-20121206/11919_1 /ASSEMBLY_ACC=CAM_ASM_000836 /TAXON_ID=2866 /ORGANISM="Crypthecodinium cohnii, Strain Seligo" /LENGTH=478 /DNA_ID=CAMNT_0053906475 /DNA_START=375 /DNA_END=1807 /DNA_ORIENTATION=+